MLVYGPDMGILQIELNHQTYLDFPFYEPVVVWLSVHVVGLSQSEILRDVGGIGMTDGDL